ncbi:MAG TPA: restriction endonuclease subunit S, partial [Aquella sp.]|nr:restriction endonuclease subunit S [Aquella sp.]
FEKSFYGTSEQTKEQGQFPVLRMGNMQNGYLNLDKLAYLDLSENEFQKYQLIKGDLLLNRTNSYDLVGKVSLFNLNEPFIAASYIVAYRPDKKILNSIFINNLLNTTFFQKKIRELATIGVSQVNINPTIFKNTIKIPLPHLEEQEKIAAILSTWDEAISRQQQLIKQKNIFKKSMLQQIFAGKIHFKDDNGNDFAVWEEKKLVKLCQIKKGEQLNKIDMLENSIYPVLNGGIEYTGFTDKFNYEESTIAISEGGNSCGYVSWVKSKFWAGGHCYILVNSLVNSSYLFQVLKYSENKIMALRVGSGLPNIQKATLEKFNLRVSLNMVEQTKIANFLTNIDTDITKQTEILGQLSQQKKSLMQKLLTGQIRVK